MDGFFSLIASLASKAFPLALLAGGTVIVGFSYIGKALAPLIPPDQLWAGALIAVILGGAGTIVHAPPVVGPPIKAAREKWRVHRHIAGLSLDAKLLLGLIAVTNERGKTVPADLECAQELIDKLLVFVRRQGRDWIRIETHPASDMIVRKHRGRLRSLLNKNSDTADSLIEIISEAEEKYRSTW